MNYKIHPFVGVENWYFGMTRDQIRELINSIPKAILGVDLEDIYHELNLHFSYTYGETPIFHAVMVCQPVSIYLDDKDLLGGESIKDLANWLKERYESVEITGDGVVVHSLGIYLSTQDFELFGDEPPESVVVFSKDSTYANPSCN